MTGRELITAREPIEVLYRPVHFGRCVVLGDDTNHWIGIPPECLDDVIGALCRMRDERPWATGDQGELNLSSIESNRKDSAT